MLKPIRIGIPRALLYHKYFAMWEEFFKELGCEVVVSPETNQQILKEGIRLAVDESCLSLKIFLGHVNFLKDKVDYLFLPRIVTPHSRESTCVKFWAISDIVRNTIPGIEVIDYTVDVKNFIFEFPEMFKVGWKFCKNPLRIFWAYIKGKEKLEKKHNKELLEQWELIKNNKDNKPNVLIVSHPYTTYDAYLGQPIIDSLKKQGMNVLFSDVVDYKKSRKLVKNITTDLYFTYNKEIVGSIEYYKGHIDGILFLMTFPCGPDALVIDLCQNKIKDIPVVVISLDELQAEAGLKTRLESFSDILKMRKKKNG